MRSRVLLVTVLAVCMIAASLVFTSCGGEEGEGGGGKVTVKIGLSAPLSGVAAEYGEDIRDGIDMALADVNEAGGLTIGDTTYIFELMARDDAAEPEQALANAQQFVLEEGINIIYNGIATTIVPLLGINTTPGEEFMLMCYTSIPLYEEYSNPLMLTEPPPFFANIPDFIMLSMGEGYRRMALLQTTGAYGELWGETFKEAWTAAGGTVVGEAPASYFTETDYTPYLTTVLAGNPDVIFCGGPSDGTALVVEQARAMGFTGGFIVIDQAKLDDMADVTGMAALEGAVGVVPIEEAENEYVKTFAQMYTDIYGERVTWETCINYSATRVLIKAMEAAGSVDDVEAIRAAFADPGVCLTPAEEGFPIQYEGFNDETGHMLTPGQDCIVKDGTWVTTEPIYWWEE